MKTSRNEAELFVVEATLRGWLVAGMHPKTIAIGLNNAFAHGEAIEEGDTYCVGDKILGKIFKGIEQMIKACEKIDD
jgi:hypothetical protein